MFWVLFAANVWEVSSLLFMFRRQTHPEHTHAVLIDWAASSHLPNPLH
jgi:hypothetical protein